MDSDSTLKIFQVDAFARDLWQGNPAAICPLQQWLPDELMQNIAVENNLSETAFYVPEGDGYRIRWFTPQCEVDLCGHATLAAAWVLFNEQGYSGDEISFASRSGELRVKKNGTWLQMDFPAQPATPCATPEPLQRAFAGMAIHQCLRGEDYLLVLESGEALRDAKPDLRALAELDLRGVAITAPGAECDFVVRFFAPKYGIDEDPVTGSAYTQLAPYWAARLDRTNLLARQLSSRGGEVRCEVLADRVLISGRAVKYMEGEIRVR